MDNNKRKNDGASRAVDEARNRVRIAREQVAEWKEVKGHAWKEGRAALGGATDAWRRACEELADARESLVDAREIRAMGRAS